MERASMMRQAVMFGLVAAAAAAAGWARGADDPPRKPLTEDGGQPVGNNQNSRTAGIGGPVLLDNFHLLQKLGRFDRERRKTASSKVACSRTPTPSATASGPTTSCSRSTGRSPRWRTTTRPGRGTSP